MNIIHPRKQMVKVMLLEESCQDGILSKHCRGGENIPWIQLSCQLPQRKWTVTLRCGPKKNRIVSQII